MTTPTQSLVDEQRLGAYLDAQLPGPPRPVHVEKHTAGFSNETYFVTRGDDEWVLRRPPGGPLLPTAHDVGREHRFLAALADTPARVPRPLLHCEDTEVIGAPFYLMERKRGHVIRGVLPAQLDNPGDRRRIGEEMIDALAELHLVDWQAVGLKGRADAYIDRQIHRWKTQAELTLGRVRDLPDLRELSAWMEANKPAEARATVVQGDYKLDNVMFEFESPARLIAIFDWEMATIGDPLADLGYFLNSWGDPSRVDTDAVPLTATGGFLTRDELAARYEERTGWTMQHLLFYEMLAQWKLIVILEGLYMGYVEGTASNPASAEFEVRVPLMLKRALQQIHAQ